MSASQICQLQRLAFSLGPCDSILPGALQIENRSEAAKRIREELFGKYTKEQLDAAALASV
jgi:hypothetical protein